MEYIIGALLAIIAYLGYTKSGRNNVNESIENTQKHINATRRAIEENEKKAEEIQNEEVDLSDKSLDDMLTIINKRKL